MKKILVVGLLLLPTVCIKVNAADVNSRVDSLANVVAAVQSDLNKCKAQLNEVAAQNLALKNALHLKPTIAESTTKDGLNFRLLNATGNRQTGKVELEIEVVNTTKQDVGLNGKSFQIVDELGHEYTDNEISSEVGNSKTPIYMSINLMPDAPVKMKVFIMPPQECQYVKAFLGTRPWGDNYRFTNIPIKWEN